MAQQQGDTPASRSNLMQGQGGYVDTSDTANVTLARGRNQSENHDQVPSLQPLSAQLGTSPAPYPEQPPPPLQPLQPPVLPPSAVLSPPLLLPAAAPAHEQRNLFLLALCWGLLLAASTLITASAPPALKSLATDGSGDSEAPLTVAAFLIGAALISLPSATLFRRFGRQRVFLLGCALGGAGGAIGVLAVFLRIWPLVVVACFLCGLSQGLGQFYRFAAVEVCLPRRKPVAITLVLTGGVLAAFVGPQLAELTTHLVSSRPYLGCFAAVAALGILNALAASAVIYPQKASNTEDMQPAPDSGARQSHMNPLLDQPAHVVETGINAKPKKAPLTTPLLTLMLRPRCLTAIALATVAHTSMSLLMVPLAIAMNEKGFSAELTTLTFELHFASMFAPGVFTGKLISRIGPIRAAAVGALAFAAAVITLALDSRFPNFIIGMALCGLGWNLLFSSGSVMLTSCYAPSDATRVQGANDFAIFFVAGSGSGVIGLVYARVGWTLVVQIAGAIMLCLAALLIPLYAKLRNKPAS